MDQKILFYMLGAFNIRHCHKVQEYMHFLFILAEQARDSVGNRKLLEKS